MSDILSFEEFTDKVREDIRSFLPPELDGAEIRVAERFKLNDSYRGLTIAKEDQHLSPAINLDEAYGEYLRTGELTPVLRTIAEIAMMPAEGVNVEALEDYDQAKEKLFIRVSNAETNRGVLENVPHETVGDLAITYHVMVDRDNEEIGSAMVTNELLKKYGISAEQLKEDAMENSAKILSPLLEPMNKVMERMMGFEGFETRQVPFEQAVEDFSFHDENMFVLTNTCAVNGAAVIFYPEVMEQLGEKAGGDLYIIPSSIHEVILVPDDGVMERDSLESIIREINSYELAPKDKLSDTLYHYDSRDHLLERAVDFEERMEMEHAIARNVEKVSIKDRLKDAEAKVNGQTAPSRPVRVQAIE